jgi:hypothetical protein
LDIPHKEWQGTVQQAKPDGRWHRSGGIDEEHDGTIDVIGEESLMPHVHVTKID